MDIMKYLLIETTVPAIVKEKKPKPVNVESAKAVGGLAGGLAAAAKFNKPLEAMDRAVASKVTPSLVKKMGKFGVSKIGGKLARAGGKLAGAGLGSWGLGAAKVAGAGTLLGAGLAGAGAKIYNKLKKPKAKE